MEKTERISRHEMLMEMAKTVARRGTCSRLQVGAVFSKEGRIIVTGYNGVPKNQPHCNHECDCGRKDPYLSHSPDCQAVLPCTLASHAERNGIDFAARMGLSLEGSELHVTHMPCLSCAGSLINVGVEVVTYLHNYRIQDGVDLLNKAGITTMPYWGRPLR